MYRGLLIYKIIKAYTKNNSITINVNKVSAMDTTGAISSYATIDEINVFINENK